MAFMKRQTYRGPYWEIETAQGTWFLPEDICGTPGAAVGSDFYPDNDFEDGGIVWANVARHFGDYVEGGPDSMLSACRKHGKLYRLSAPGYLDCTEWTTDPNSPEFDEDEDEDRAD